MRKEKKIPTFIGIAVLILGLFVGVFLVQNAQQWFLKAEQGVEPENVKITNVSENSFTLSWTTQKPVIGYVVYGETTSLKFRTSDRRDPSEEKSMTTHYVEIVGLKPQTKYYFKIGSGKLYDNQGKPFEINTGPALSKNPASDIAQGTVLKPDGTSAEGAFVYLKLPHAAPLSSYVTASGSFIVVLNNARTEDLSSYVTYDKEATVEEIFIQAGPGLGTATAVTTTKFDNPIPTIILGKSYDFREQQTPTEPGSEEEKNLQEKSETGESNLPPASKFSLTPIGKATESTSAGELTITNPSINEKINTQKPEIIGTGSPGAKISITVESTRVQSGEVIADKDGDWDWEMPENLSTGEHTITASYTDPKGIIHKITRNFTVLAAGESNLPSIETSPSATVIPTASPSATPIATEVGRTKMPSTQGGVPSPGLFLPTLLVFFSGILFLIFGISLPKLIKAIS